MSQMQNARPGEAGPGTGGETAGERVSANPTDITETTATAVPTWLYRRGGDPVVIRRRIAAELDDLLGIYRGRAPVPDDVDWYHVTGLDLDVQEREAAAPAPMGCAA